MSPSPFQERIRRLWLSVVGATTTHRRSGAGADENLLYTAADRTPEPIAGTPIAADEVWLAMLRGLPDAALVLDRDRNVVAANAAAAALLTTEPGRHLVHISRSPELLAAVDRALSAGEAQSFQMRTMVPIERALMGLATPLVPPIGPPGDPDATLVRPRAPALLLVLRDTTEQDRLSRMRADFVANASHELRTPLASLKGFVETLRDAAKDDPAARERFLGIMHEQAERMSRLIDDLLSLSRIEMREHVAPRDRVDLSTIIASVVAALDIVAVEAGIRLVLQPTAAPMMVIGDRDELHQVVQNLVQNAIKYGRRGGQVEILVSRDRARVLMTVSDDGIGIPAKHLPRLTERFYRVSAKDSRERGGTGLGLAIVKHILNRHRGDLRITSEAGRGSIFTVLLPCADPT